MKNNVQYKKCMECEKYCPVAALNKEEKRCRGCKHYYIGHYIEGNKNSEYEAVMGLKMMLDVDNN